MKQTIHLANILHLFQKGEDNQTILKKLIGPWTDDHLVKLRSLYKKLQPNQSLEDQVNAIRRDLGHHLLSPDAIPPNTLNIPPTTVKLLNKLVEKKMLAISEPNTFEFEDPKNLSRTKSYWIPLLTRE